MPQLREAQLREVQPHGVLLDDAWLHELLQDELPWYDDVPVHDELQLREAQPSLPRKQRYDDELLDGVPQWRG